MWFLFIQLCSLMKQNCQKTAVQLSIQPCIKTTFEAWLARAIFFPEAIESFQLKTCLRLLDKKTILKSLSLSLSLSANQCVCLHGTTANNKARNHQKLLPSQISDRARQKRKKLFKLN